jgi:hypothetical protein
VPLCSRLVPMQSVLKVNRDKLVADVRRVGGGGALAVAVHYAGQSFAGKCMAGNLMIREFGSAQLRTPAILSLMRYRLVLAVM